MAVEGTFPLLNLYGDPGSNKSIIAESALSLIGKNWTKEGIVSTLSESALFELLKNLGSLPICYDDPTKDKNGALSEIIKKLFNRHTRKVRGNEQKPHSGLMLTSNHAIGDNSAASRSRMLRISMPVTKGRASNESYQKLRSAQKEASGCFSQLISLGYPKIRIDELESLIEPNLPKAHSRAAKILAIVTCYTQLLCDLAEKEFNALDYAIKVLCLEHTDSEDNSSSLEDFLKNVATLQNENKVGDWLIKKQEKEGQTPTVAIVFRDVWSLIEERFSPTYSKTVVRSLIAQVGKKELNNIKCVDTSRLFDKDRQSSMNYRSAMQKGETIDNPQKSKSCVIIPLKLWEEVTGDILVENNPDGYNDEPWDYYEHEQKNKDINNNNVAQNGNGNGAKNNHHLPELLTKEPWFVPGSVAPNNKSFEIGDLVISSDGTLLGYVATIENESVVMLAHQKGGVAQVYHDILEGQIILKGEYYN
jgi:hypothetical protein